MSHWYHEADTQLQALGAVATPDVLAIGPRDFRSLRKQSAAIMRWAETVAELRHEAVALAGRGCLNILLRDGTPVGDCIGALEHYAQGVGQLAQQCSSLSDEAMTPAQVATLFATKRSLCDRRQHLQTLRDNASVLDALLTGPCSTT